MANLTGEITVKVFAEASDELKAFIRAEVRKALQEEVSGMSEDKLIELKQKYPSLFKPDSEQSRSSDRRRA